MCWNKQFTTIFSKLKPEVLFSMLKLWILNMVGKNKLFLKIRAKASLYKTHMLHRKRWWYAIKQLKYLQKKKISTNHSTVKIRCLQEMRLEKQIVSFLINCIYKTTQWTGKSNMWTRYFLEGARTWNQRSPKLQITREWWFHNWILHLFFWPYINETVIESILYGLQKWEL